MTAARPRQPAAARWVAPVLLVLVSAALAPLWWRVTAPPILATVSPSRDAGGVLLLPAAAVRPPGPTGRVEPAGPANVFVVQDGVAHLTRVHLGSLRGDAIEVRDGLAEAAQVIANPPRGLEDRHRVAPP